MAIDQVTGEIERAPEPPPEYLNLKVKALSVALEIHQKGYVFFGIVAVAMDELGEFYPTWLEDVCRTLNTETKTVHSSACRYKKAVEDGWFRAELTPQHHTEVDNKKLSVNDRSELLDKAIMHGWTTPQLREQVKERLGVCAQTDDEPDDNDIFRLGFYRRGELLEKILEANLEMPKELAEEIRGELE